MQKREARGLILAEEFGATRDSLKVMWSLQKQSNNAYYRVQSKIIL